MIKYFLIFCLLSCSFCGKAQGDKYVLELRYDSISFEPPSVLILRYDKGISKLLISKPVRQWVLDSLILFPQSVQIDFYKNCTKDEILQLMSIGASTKDRLSTDFFLTKSVQCLSIHKDSMSLLNPNQLQVKFQEAQKEISARIESFNRNINDKLINAFKLTNNKKEKDSIQNLASALFKVNVARINLDSTLYPFIQKNLDNSLSLYGIDEYIRVSRMLDFPIPKSSFIRMLLSMSSNQKQFPNWSQLFNTLKVLNPKKTLVGSVAPEFRQLFDTSGNQVYLKNLRGKIIFIDFWASWCRPCLSQLPMLKKIYKNVAGSVVVFLGISLDSDSKSWKQEINQSDLPWLQATDLKGDRGLTVVEYGITSIPHNFLIDKEGTIVEENVPLSNLMREIEKIQANRR